MPRGVCAAYDASVAPVGASCVMRPELDATQTAPSAPTARSVASLTFANTFSDKNDRVLGQELRSCDAGTDGVCGAVGFGVVAGPTASRAEIEGFRAALSAGPQR